MIPASLTGMLISPEIGPRVLALLLPIATARTPERNKQMRLGEAPQPFMFTWLIFND